MENNRDLTKFEDKFDLYIYYKNDKGFSEDLIYLRVEVGNFLTKIFDDLYSLLIYLENLEPKIYRLKKSSKLRRDVDLRNNDNSEFYNDINRLKIEFLKIKHCKEEMFISVNSSITSIILTDKRLKLYEKYISGVLFRQKKAAINNKEVNYLPTFRKMINRDFKYSDIFSTDLVRLPMSNHLYSLYLRSNDRTLRKNAYIESSVPYTKHKDELFEMLIKQFKYKSKIKVFGSSFLSDKEYSLFLNKFNCNENILNDYFKYFEDKYYSGNMYIFDMYVNPHKSPCKFSLVRAKENVFNSLIFFGSEYTRTIDLLNKEKWIDYKPFNGKRAGAYTIDGYLNRPYILMNYNNVFKSSITIAHELGHSVKRYLTNENNNYLNSTYDSLFGEIAALVNEIRYLDYMIENSNGTDKKYFLFEFLNNFRTVFFRQGVLCLFEQKLMDKIKNGEIIDINNVSRDYMAIFKSIYGTNIKLIPNSKYSYLRSTTLYKNNYLYKYPLSICIAIYIYLKIKEDIKYLKIYNKFLSSGSNDKVLLEEFGVMFNNFNFVDDALKYFDKLFTLYKEL